MLRVDLSDHNDFMREVEEIFGQILGRPVASIDRWEQVTADVKKTLNESLIFGHLTS